MYSTFTLHPKINNLRRDQNMRRSWTAAEEECLLSHIEAHKGSNGQWLKDSSKAVEQVMVELEAVKPSGEMPLSKRQIRDKIRGIATRIPERRLAKPGTIFSKGPAALNLREKLNVGAGRRTANNTAETVQLLKVFDRLLCHTQ
jgi:hypothetical protein